jgi:hypothetical protein
VRPASSRSLNAAAILAIAVATGCTSLEWTKAGASAEDATRELQACRIRAWREAEMPPPRREAAPVIHVTPGPGGAPNVAVLTPRSDPFEGWSEEQRRFAETCMREKGYALVPTR